MPKAILELPKMPESCGQCNLCVYAIHTGCWHCAGLKGVRKCPREGKRADCPLKLVEGKDEQTNVKCRYCNSESVEIIARGTESILYKCRVCKMEFAKLNIKEVEP